MKPKKIKKKKVRVKEKDPEDENPVSTLFNSNPIFMKMMQYEYEPIPLSGPKAAGPNSVPADRKVVWKRVCQI